MRDPQLAQPHLPAFELGSVTAPERDMVQTRPVLVEAVTDRSAGQRVQTQQVAIAASKHGVVEGAGVRIEHRPAAQYPLVRDLHSGGRPTATESERQAGAAAIPRMRWSRYRRIRDSTG